MWEIGKTHQINKQMVYGATTMKEFKSLKTNSHRKKETNTKREMENDAKSEVKTNGKKWTYREQMPGKRRVHKMFRLQRIRTPVDRVPIESDNVNGEKSDVHENNRNKHNVQIEKSE